VDEKRFRRVALALAAAGTLHALVYLPLISPHSTADTQSYTDAAHAILRASYSVPLRSPDITGLYLPKAAEGAYEHDTFRSPGYPLVLAATGGGTSDVSRGFLFALQALLMGVSVWLLALVARGAFGARAGLAAAAIYALDPYSKRYVALVLSEATATVLALATAYAVVRAWRGRSARWWAAAGLAAGALTLTRPLLALAVPLVALGALVTLRPLRTAFAGAAAALAAALVLVMPWVGWNAAVTGKFSLSTSGEGWNLLLAAHGEGLHRTLADVIRDPEYRRDYLSVRRFAPSAEELRRDKDAHSRYLARADAELRNLAEDEYGHRLRSEPASVLGEIAYRSYFLWMAHEDWYQPDSGFILFVLRLADWIVLAFAAAGCALALARSGPGRAIAAFLLLFTAVNALHHVEARYAIPVRGLYLALAALAGVALAKRIAHIRGVP
jgi:4-amino-4-deoxy-L-arabinose transferase-like glycosyltransferase